jgi:hypothetical protein
MNLHFECNLREKIRTNFYLGIMAEININDKKKYVCSPAMTDSGILLTLEEIKTCLLQCVLIKLCLYVNYGPKLTLLNPPPERWEQPRSCSLDK